MYIYKVPVSDGENRRTMIVKADDPIWAVMEATRWCRGTRWQITVSIETGEPVAQ